MKEARNRQKEFWSGSAGNAYTNRNKATEESISRREKMWGRILKRGGIDALRVVTEVGSNVGINILALDRHFRGCEFIGVEINDQARLSMTANGVVKTGNDFSTIYDVDRPASMIFTSGVLIHTAPHDLPNLCKAMYERSTRWIVCIEYFSDQPREIPYHGHDELLWLRDYGKLWMELFPDLRPRACGFEWKEITGLDNLTWWVFEKGAA